MQIAEVQFADFSPLYAGSGFRMSYIHLTRHQGRLVRLMLADGRSGLGEIARPLRVDAEQAIGAEDTCAAALIGQPLSAVPSLAADWRAEGQQLYGFVTALETAFFDLVGRAAGVPVSSLLGGPVRRDLPEYFALSSGAPEEMAAAVQAGAAGFPVIQAKLGIDDLETDMRRVEAVLAAMGPDQLLMGDFNEALAPADALAALPAILDPRLVWEEPCRGYEANLEVPRGLAQPVMFDQCLTGLPDVVRALRDGAAAVLAVKPVPLGGLTAARTARDLCAAAGVRMRIDGPWSGQIGTAAVLHLAMGAAPELLTASLDLTGPLETSRQMIHHPAPGRVALADGPGLGPIPEGIFPETETAK